MKQEAMQKHPEEWFFLHNFDVDRVFSTIRRTDYLVLFYIKMRQESHPDEKLYLADLAAEMGVKVTELSKGIEKLQDQGYVRWLTDREAGRTYVELTSKAVENEIIVLDKIELAEAKTKYVAQMLKAVNAAKKAMIVTADADTSVVRAGSNIEGVKVSHVGMLNVVDILGYTSFIVTKDAINKLEALYDDTVEAASEEVNG